MVQKAQFHFGGKRTERKMVCYFGFFVFGNGDDEFGWIDVWKKTEI